MAKMMDLILPIHSLFLGIGPLFGALLEVQVDLHEDVMAYLDQKANMKCFAAPFPSMMICLGPLGFSALAAAQSEERRL